MRVARRVGVGLAGLMVALGVTSQAQTPKPMSEAEMKAAGGRQLAAAEMRQKAVGNTGYILVLKDSGPWRKGSVFAVFYRDDRTRINAAGRGRKIETLWWFEGDNICGEQRLNPPDNVCYRHYELGTTTYLCGRPPTDCFATIRIVPGNPENL